MAAIIDTIGAGTGGTAKYKDDVRHREQRSYGQPDPDQQ